MPGSRFENEYPPVVASGVAVILTAACVKLEVPVKVTVTLGMIRSLVSLTVLPLTSRNTKPERVDGVDCGVVSVGSLRIVPVPTAAPSAALVGFEITTEKVSLGSRNVSPTTCTVTVAAVTPGANVTVPLVTW